MGVEKQGSKSGGGYVGGFFQLFDWNGKSRKKLFSGKSDLPVGSKQGKRSDDNLPMTRFHLDDEHGGVSSFHGSSDYSSASSLTDDEGNGIRAPSVVARLMGLDSLPTSSFSEPHATPFFESQSLQDMPYRRRTPEYLNEYQRLSVNNLLNKVDGICRKTTEPSPQKLQNSKAIERFRTETLPPKSAKSHPITHHKLLSPIKSPGFLSAKNASHIMEAAAKILEPGLQAGPKGKFPSVASSSGTIKVQHVKENVAASQRTLRLPEASRRPVESNAVKYLKGQSLNKSWNGSEDTHSFRASSDLEENHSTGSKNKGKSISLVIQANVNVQRREGLCSSSKSLSTSREGNGYKPKQPVKNQTNTLKGRQSKSSTCSASGVLRQNNQKQNVPVNKEKLPSKPSLPSQQIRKPLSGDASSGRNRTFTKVSGNSKVGPKKEGLETVDTQKNHPSSRTKNLAQKKQAVDGDFHFEKRGFTNAVSTDRNEKAVHSHAMINEHCNWTEDNRRKGMDVVSFTFKSPMNKPMTGSLSSSEVLEKRENICQIDSQNESYFIDAKSKRKSSLGLNVIGGDALSILLEQKLTELTSDIESSNCGTVKAGKVNSSASILQDLVAALNTVSTMPREFDRTPQPVSQTDKLGYGYDTGFSASNHQGLKMNFNLLGDGETTDSSGSFDTRKELDSQHASPVSILEASFSNESCISSESCHSCSKSFSSIQAKKQSGLSCPRKISSVDAETELSDSASSAFSGTSDTEQIAVISLARAQLRLDKQEMEYVREIVSDAEVMLKDFPLGDAHEVIDPLLFDRLENKKTKLRNEEDESRTRRKVLFDCVNECLDLRCSLYSNGGYRTWAKGVAVVRKDGLAEEVYKEILGWRSMGNWMVDKLVDKDMSSHLGRWTNFETEAFEIGVEIERRILRSLVDEAFADML